MMGKKFFLAIFFAFVGILNSDLFAQNKAITGTVVDSAGNPVSNVSIKIKGTSRGSATDNQGVFKIHAIDGQTLVVSAINYIPQEIAVGNREEYNIVLRSNNANLSDVVVTALGRTEQKAKVGYSVATFNSSQINQNAPVGMFDNIMGKVAGADISNIGGPGASTKVILRGYGVISGGNNAPLYVIDGVPLANNQPYNTSSTDFGNGMNDINPSDIASINILKGTAATALYGSLARNGAVIVTTKSGQAGKLKVDFNGGADFSRVGKLPKFQDMFGTGWGFEYIPDENGSWGPALDGIVRPWGSIVDNSQLIKPFSFVENNIRNFYTTGVAANNNLSISGGNDHNKFYFSYGNVTSDGVIPTKTDFLERNTFSLRTNTTYGKFSFNAFFNYINRKMNAPNTGQGSSSGGGVFESLLQIPVDIPIQDFSLYTNKFFNVDNYFTPYAENPYYGLHENGDQNRSDRFLGNLEMKYQFTPALSIMYRLGGDFENSRTESWNQPNAPANGSWNGPNPTNPEGASRQADVGSYTKASQYYGTINNDLILEYNKNLNSDFSLDVLAGANYYQSTYDLTQVGITNLVIPGFFNLSNSTNPPSVYSGSETRTRNVGLYGQATLGYKNQLYLTGNVRNDWSSTLPINNNSIFYPGANLSWVASNTFDMSSSPVSYLKLRAAYGETGASPSAYQTSNVLSATSVSLGFGSLSSPLNGVSAFGISNTINNQGLKPIMTKEFETGFEIRFLKDRIGLDATYYHKNTDGQIFSVPIAPSTGYTSLVENLGSIGNQGIELTLNIIPVKTENFEWSFNYNFAKDWNKVLNLNGGTPNPLLNSVYDVELRAVVGKTVAEIYAPTPQLSPSGQIVVNAQTGFPVVNATPNASDNNTTKKDLGTALYNYTMGFSNSLRYKNVTLDFALDYRFGGLMYSQTANLSNFVGNAYNTTYNDRKPFIVPNSVVATTDANGNTVYSENTTPIPASDMYDYYYETKNPAMAYNPWIIPRSFLKLRSVNLSYGLPKRWVNAIKLSNISVGVYAKNILLWTPARNMFVDPEATNLGTDLTGMLGEFATAPLQKEFGFTLKASF